MKKALLIIALMLGSVAASSAQNLDKNEAKQLKAFLSEPSRDGTNASALKVSNIGSFGSIEGVTVENGHVTAIEWKDKKLSGALDLSGFKALNKVDVSRNDLTSLSVEECAQLTELNAGRNKISEIDLNGCESLQKVAVYKNRLTDISLSDTPMLENLNVSNNLFVELSLANTTSLKTDRKSTRLNSSHM